MWLAILSVLALPLFSQSLLPDIGSNFTPFSCSAAAGPNWLLLSGIVLMGSVLMIALAYMAGSALSSPKIIAWAKEGLFQTAASALIIAGFVVFGLTIDTTLSAVTGRPNVTLIDNGMDYAKVIESTILSNFLTLNVMNIAIGVFGNMQINLRAGGFGLSFSLAPMFRPILDALGLLVNFMMAALWEWFAQLFLLCFIKQQMLTVFMPLGIILRAFPITRSAGGAIIAIAVGLYFVYPFMLTVNQVITTAHYGNPLDRGGSSCNFTGFWDCAYETYGSSVINTLLKGTVKTGSGLVLTAVFAKTYVTGLMALAAPVFSSVILTSIAISVYYYIFDLVYLLVIVSMLLTLLNVFVTMTSIREIAKFLDSDLNLSSLLRML